MPEEGMTKRRLWATVSGAVVAMVDVVLAFCRP